MNLDSNIGSHLFKFGTMTDDIDGRKSGSSALGLLPVESHVIDNDSVEDEYIDSIEDLKRLQTKLKSAFTRKKHAALRLLDEDIPSRRKVRIAQEELSTAQENAI